MKNMRSILTIAVVGLSVMSFGVFAVPTHHKAEHQDETRVTQQASEQSIAKIDLNTASATQLETVKGIGPKRAQAIINYRKDHGQFTKVEQLTNVKGIGMKRLAKIRDNVTL